MQTLREYIAEAEANKRAIGHFNISDSEQLQGIARAARGLDLPVIIGVSEGERDFIGVPEAAALVRALREEGAPVFLNADHSYSPERVEEAAKAGFDAAIFDGAKLSLEENIAATKRAVSLAKAVKPDILVEAELGYIGTSSKVLEALPEGAAALPEQMTKSEEARRFVTETGIDLFAPAVGNIHGMVKGGNPRLNIPLIKELRAAAGVPLVLHGGSGISDEDFRAAIEAGIAIVHINTELRAAYRKGIEEGLAEKPDELAPYRFMEGGVEAVEAVARERLALFAGR